jgi:hypothetical protein
MVMGKPDYDRLLEESNVAENLRGGLKLYLARGIIPGDFLRACLENNLSEAIGRASTQSWDYLYGVVFFLYNYAPASSWGSAEKVKEWSKMLQSEEG